VSVRDAGDRGAFERALRDRAAPHYDDWYRHTKGVAFDSRERAVFRERAGDARRVLDLGAGTGRITDALRDRPNVVAVDFSRPSLRALAEKALPHATPVVGDATAIPLEDGTCDVVVSCQVLQHLDRERLPRVLRECARVLVPGGRLIASVYNRDYWRSHDVRTEIDVPDHLYVRKFSAAEFAELASAAGFRRSGSGAYKAVPDGGRVPERLIRWYARVDALVCRVFPRRGGCYLLYEGVRVA
jgi:ubiquinone/menaquinone biosynthesis C-methylase UbiE